LPLGTALTTRLRLHLTHPLVVERNIGIDIGIQDQAIISHHFDTSALGFGNDVVRTLPLNGTITSTSTLREIRFSICAIWRSSLASADCT
jgi:hypothetical protein